MPVAAIPPLNETECCGVPGGTDRIISAHRPNVAAWYDSHIVQVNDGAVAGVRTVDDTPCGAVPVLNQSCRWLAEEPTAQMSFGVTAAIPDSELP